MFGLTKRIVLIVLSVWLILTGLISLTGISFPAAGLILSVLAIVAGVLILLAIGIAIHGALLRRTDAVTN